LRQSGMAEADGASQSDEEIDLAADDAIQESQRRDSLLTDGYPFASEDNVMSLGDSLGAGLAYTCLLVITMLRRLGRRAGERHFEYLVADAIGRHLGGQGIRFGWPRKPPVPSNPEGAVDYLCNEVREPRSHGFPVRTRDKDMGLDVVGWKRFPDEKRGKL